MKDLKITKSITAIDSQSITNYLNDIRNIPLLTKEEEWELAKKIKKGCVVSRDKLVKHNLRFVISVANQYNTNKLSLNDKINEGNYGLIIAANRFDEQRGFKFISYAVWWVRRYIQEAISETSHITLPTHYNKFKSEIQKAEENAYSDGINELSYDELIEKTGLKINEIEACLALTHVDSTDSPVKGDSDFTILDFYSHDSYNEDSEEDKMDVYKRILNSILTKKEYELCLIYFGLDNNEPKNITSIAESMNTKAQNISFHINSAKKKMKKNSSLFNNLE